MSAVKRAVMSAASFAGVLAGVLAVGGCGPAPDPAACIDRIAPSWRELGLIADDGTLVEAPNLRLLTINVGHGRSDAGAYDLRLASRSYEARLSARLQAAEADIIAIQEVLPRAQCQLAQSCPLGRDTAPSCATRSPPASCAALTCDQAHAGARDGARDQVQRLVGPGYSIACAGLDEPGIDSVDCLAVRDGFAQLFDSHADELLPPGSYEPRWGEDRAPGASFWRPQGFAPCDFTAGECNPKAAVCDRESSVFAVDLALGGDPQQRMRVVHLHPPAFGDGCRQRQLAWAFAQAERRWVTAPDEATVMIGDWNFDPDRLVQPTEEALYAAYVGPHRRLHEHDEREADCSRVATAPRIAGRRPAAIDRVVTDFAAGLCRSYGGPSGLSSFDKGRGPEPLPATPACGCCFPGDIQATAIDHLAVACDLYWPDAPLAPRELPPL